MDDSTYAGSVVAFSTDCILPVVRSLEEATPLLIDGALCRILGPDIALLYVQDLGYAYLYLTSEHLSQLELTPDGIHALALENLGARELQIHGDGLIRMVTCGGTYEAGLVLRPDLWIDRVGLEDAAHAAVLLAAHDVLMVCDRREPMALERLAEIGGQIHRDGVEHLVSPELFAPGMPLVPIPPPTEAELQEVWDSINPNLPRWRFYSLLTVVSVAFAIAGAQTIGEFVQSNQLDLWLSWRVIAILAVAPAGVLGLVAQFAPDTWGPSIGLRLSAMAWTWLALLFVAALGLCAFAIDAMPRTYVLNGLGAAASVYMAWLYVAAARHVSRRYSL